MLSVVGLNHQTAPLAVRERAAISPERLPEALSSLRSHIPQGVILSTCNRTEIYSVGEDTEEASREFLKGRLNLPEPEWSGYLYAYRGREAAEHLFRVASSLESQVVGEFEVLGQVRGALEAAEKAGMVNLALRQAFQDAVRAGRRVREETGISQNALSISSVAVELAAGVVGDLCRCKMVVVGAGEAGRLVARVARERGTSQLVIASRTKKRAAAVAESLKGRPTDLSCLVEELSTADIVVTCAAAPHPILDVPRIQEAMKHRSELPLVIIDIALPRNVVPEVGKIPQVFLYNLDDLTEISRRNRRQREAEVQKAEQLITDEVSKFTAWWELLEVRPVVTALMTKAEEIRLAHLNQTLKKLPPLSPEQRESLEAMTRSIVTKLLQEPIQYLKAKGNGSADTVKELFHLDPEKPA